jgi:hypothetical protein
MREPPPQQPLLFAGVPRGPPRRRRHVSDLRDDVPADRVGGRPRQGALLLDRVPQDRRARRLPRVRRGEVPAPVRARAGLPLLRLVVLDALALAPRIGRAPGEAEPRDGRRWHTGRGLESLIELQGGKTRQRYKGRWRGREAGRLGGKQRGYTDEHVRQVRGLRSLDRNIGRVRLARLTKLSEDQVRAILADLKG